MSAAIQELRRLHRHGFAVQRLFTHDGSPGCLLYLRQRDQVREVVLVADENSAIAYRTDCPVNPSEPFDLPQNFRLWHQHGDVTRVCHGLFSSRRTDS